jgi:hypothetical protein
MPAQCTQARHRLVLSRIRHGALDKRRRPVVQQLACDPVGRRPDARHRAEGVRVDERRDRLLQPQHGLRRARVAESPLALLPRQRRHVEKEPGQLEIDVPHPTRGYAILTSSYS